MQRNLLPAQCARIGSVVQLNLLFHYPDLWVKWHAQSLCKRRIVQVCSYGTETVDWVQASQLVLTYQESCLYNSWLKIVAVINIFKLLYIAFSALSVVDDPILMFRYGHYVVSFAWHVCLWMLRCIFKFRPTLIMNACIWRPFSRAVVVCLIVWNRE